MPENIKIALLGYGYWGKNVARVLTQHPQFSLRYICDLDPTLPATLQKFYPKAEFCTDFEYISENEIDAVAIITPAETHFELAQYFLERGKHVYISKPFTKNVEQANLLLELGAKNNCSVFVDHTFVFHPAVNKLKELLPKIGKPFFLLSQRLNLGLYQEDVNVIDDLMSHDLSMALHLFPKQTVTSAKTVAFKAAGLAQEDFAQTSFVFGDGMHGFVSVSWLSPLKVRQFFVVGSDGMLVYDDTATSEKVKFFDKGITVSDVTRVSYKNGDMYSPTIPTTEALYFSVDEFRKTLTAGSERKYYSDLSFRVMDALAKIHKGIA